MDTHTPTAQRPDEFAPGTEVIYGMHGRCRILAVESRSDGSQNQSFYKLELVRSTFARSSRQEPAIWVPVTTARTRGLRLPLTQAETDAVFQLAANREYYFDPNLPWTTLQSRLENTIRAEGAVGLVKALSLLYVLRRRQVVPTPEVNKMFESVSRLLMRELSEATGELAKTLEERLIRSMRHKLIPDT